MKTTKAEKEKLKCRIIEKAIPYFKENGNSGSGINSLMKQAGVTTGALYSNFGSKDDLLAEAICSELEKLESEFFMIFKRERKKALKFLIETYFDLLNYQASGDGCIYTALGTDMHRSRASDRARYEEYTKRIYQLFADATHEQFPDQTPEACYEKALVIYSGFVGAMTMARIMKNQDIAHKILETEKRFMLETFVAPENR